MYTPPSNDLSMYYGISWMDDVGVKAPKIVFLKHDCIVK